MFAVESKYQKIIFKLFFINLKSQIKNRLYSYERRQCSWGAAEEYCKTNRVISCCDGFENVNDQCLLPCNNCVNKYCNQSNFCDCEIGYSGASESLRCNQSKIILFIIAIKNLKIIIFFFTLACQSGTFGEGDSLNGCEFNCKHILNPVLNKNFTLCFCEEDFSTVSSECRHICKCRQKRYLNNFASKTHFNKNLSF